MIKKFGILFLLLNTLSAQSQDSTFNWNYENYLNWVMEYHPMAQRAQLKEDYAAANLMKSKGSFDPKIAYNLGHKEYEGKKYYNLQEAGLKVPAWFGDVKIDYSNFDGQFLNNEREVPENGLIGVGFELPLGKGLFIDQRRTTLKQAKLNQSISEYEKRMILNDLYFMASVSYFSWQNAYERKLIFEEILDAVVKRNNNTLQKARIGEYAGIDTVEANIQLYMRLQQYEKAKFDFIQHKNGVEALLWFNMIPLELDSLIEPESANLNEIDRLEYYNLLDSIGSYHPEILTYVTTNSILEVEERWLKEAFKPELNLGYSYIQSPDLFLNETPNFTEDFKVEASVSFPIFLRKERAQVALIQIKNQENNLKLIEKSRSIKLKVINLMEEYDMLQKQFNQNTQIVADYKELLAAENRLFDLGESSLFMVNSREQKLLEYELKQADLRLKIQLAILKLDYLLFLNT